MPDNTSPSNIGSNWAKAAPWVGLGVTSLAEAYRFYQGLKQKQEAEQLAKTKRPFLKTPIPGGITENVRLAKDSFGSSGLPGQGYYENQLDRSVQSGARNLVETGHGADTAAGIAALENSKMNAIEGMGADAAKLSLSKLSTLMGANSELGGFEAKAFENDWNWNERDPYLQSMAAASALRNAGEANTFNAISNISTLAGSIFAMGDNGGGETGGSGTPNNTGYTTPSNDVNAQVDLRNPGQGQYDFNSPANNDGLSQQNSVVRQQMILDLQAKYPQLSVQKIEQMLSGR